MKKMTGFLSAALLLAAAMILLSVPVFAEDAPAILAPANGEGISIRDNGEYLIGSGKYTTGNFFFGSYEQSKPTLTIAPDAVVVADGCFDNYGTIHVFGTLVVPQDIGCNYGTIHVGCGGKLLECFKTAGSVVYDRHTFENGVCTGCGRGESGSGDDGPSDYFLQDRSPYRHYAKDSYLIGYRDYEVRALSVGSAETVTVAPGVTLTVNEDFSNHGTLNVLGTLVLKQSTGGNSGAIHVGCGGKLEERFTYTGIITYDPHTFENGVCTACGIRKTEAGEDEPTELVPENGGIQIGDNGHYLIRGGDHTVSGLMLGEPQGSRPTLIIARGATVTVDRSFQNYGTLHVLGTLILKTDNSVNGRTIRVGCGGKVLGQFSDHGTVLLDDHAFADGVCTVCGIGESEAASAKEGPAECVSQDGVLDLTDDGAYILGGGNETVSIFRVWNSREERPVLTIPRGVTLTVDGIYSNNGTIRVLGSLIVKGDTAVNAGTILVDCGGKLAAQFSAPGTIVYEEHSFEDGVCTGCGYVCPHEEWDDGTCRSCGYVCPHEGNPCVLCGKELRAAEEGTDPPAPVPKSSLPLAAVIACAAVLGLGGTVIGIVVGKRNKIGKRR